VIARGSNINRDIRRDHPFAAYSRLNIKVPVFQYGDVRARMRVRIEEIAESISIINRVCREMPEGEISAEPVKVAKPGEWRLSAVEGWRGEILYFVMAGEEGKVHRCKVRDPSFVNWPALQYAVLGNIVPDFPLINKSFNLSYAGNDL
jgi:Ni,Fe-hydrogenase III large subunit